MDKGLITGCILLLQLGCQSTEHLKTAPYNADPDCKYPAVTLIVNNSELKPYNTAPQVDPYRTNILENEAVYEQAGLNKSDVDMVVQLMPLDRSSNRSTDDSEFQGKRIVGSATPYIDPDKPVILKNLRESGLFERVDINNAYADVILHVSISREMLGSGFEQAGKMLMSCGSLFCLPTAFDFRFSMTIDITHHEQVISSYHYSDDLHDYFFILEDPTEDHNQMIRVLLSRFYRDLQEDRILDDKNLLAPSKEPAL